MSRKKWIAVDCRMVEHSGIGRYLQAIMPSLCSKYRVTTMGNSAQLAAYEWFRSDDHVELRSGIYNPFEQIEMALKIPGSDLLWSPHFTVPFLPVRAKKRVVTVHDMFHLRHSEEFSGSALTYLKLLFRKVAGSARVITVSEFSKSEIADLSSVASDKIEVIYNGVDTESFCVKKQTTTVSLDLPQRYLLYVGNVKPHKNLKTLLEGFMKIAEKYPDCHLVIAGKKDGFINGDPQLWRKIEESTLLKERVVFTGFVPEKDLAELYRRADLLVFPSLYEGFGLPPLEAMACGVPVAASDSASIPEVCGNGAIYFDPMDIDLMAERIELILEDSEYRDDLIKKGYAVIKEFSWKNSIDKHIALFEEILGKSE